MSAKKTITDYQALALEEAIRDYQGEVNRGPGGHTAVIEATPGNGSRVVVTATHLPVYEPILGGDLMVVVHIPGPKVHTLDGSKTELHWEYAVEKFVPHGVANMGDIYGIVRAVADATDRTLVGVPDPSPCVVVWSQ